MAQQACAFKDPVNLKEILDLLAKLYDAKDVQNSVAHKLVEGIQKYCKETTKFY